MKTTRRTEMVEHLSETQLDEAINEAQKADETEWSASLLNRGYAGMLFESGHSSERF